MKGCEVNKEAVIADIVKNLKTIDIMALIALITTLLEEKSFRHFYYSGVLAQPIDVTETYQLISDTLDALLTDIGVFNDAEIRISLLDDCEIRKLLHYYIDQRRAK